MVSRVLLFLLVVLAPVIGPTLSAQEPTAEAFSSSRANPEAVVLAQPVRPAVELARICNSEKRKRPECRFRWKPALRQSVRFLGFQHVSNVIVHEHFRAEVTRGNFFEDYATSLRNYRFDRWSDDDALRTDYIGHPMMGAITGFIQIHNDPGGAGLEFGKSKAYWKSRMRAMGYAAAYSAQWELGPISESTIGNVGIREYVSEHNGKLTNGTGLVDLVVTPTLGTAWLITEDALDRFVVQRLEKKSQRPAWLLTVSLLNPTRSVANALRLRYPWYRDTREVKSRPFFRP